MKLNKEPQHYAEDEEETRCFSPPRWQGERESQRQKIEALECRLLKMEQILTSKFQELSSILHEKMGNLAINIANTKPPMPDPTPLYNCCQALKDGINVHIREGLEQLIQAISNPNNQQNFSPSLNFMNPNFSIGEQKVNVEVQPSVTVIPPTINIQPAQRIEAMVYASLGNDFLDGIELLANKLKAPQVLFQPNILPAQTKPEFSTFNSVKVEFDPIVTAIRELAAAATTNNNKKEIRKSFTITSVLQLKLPSISKTTTSTATGETRETSEGWVQTKPKTKSGWTQTHKTNKPFPSASPSPTKQDFALMIKAIESITPRVYVQNRTFNHVELPEPQVMINNRMFNQNNANLLVRPNILFRNKTLVTAPALPPRNTEERPKKKYVGKITHKADCSCQTVSMPPPEFGLPPELISALLEPGSGEEYDSPMSNYSDEQFSEC